MERRTDISYIIGLVFLFIFIAGNPIIFVPIIIIAAFVFFLTKINNINPNFNIQNQNRGTVYSSRQTALSHVKLYLAPYNSIWRNLRVSNKLCTLRLGSDGKTITGSEKTSTSSYRKFKIVESKIHTMSEVWDMFCLNFDHQTSYDGLIELCQTFRLSYTEDNVGESFPNQKESVIKTDSHKTDTQLDINNATEVEITALPGISIVISKKIIKRREEIGGFKNIDEFFKFLKLKPHMENQIRPLICAKKMKGSLSVARTEERRIDL